MQYCLEMASLLDFKRILTKIVDNLGELVILLQDAALTTFDKSMMLFAIALLMETCFLLVI